MNTIIKSLGFFVVMVALTVFSGNAFAGMDDYESAVERGWSFDEAIQEQLDADKG